MNSSESLNSSESTAPNKPVGLLHRFSCWSFHSTFSADSTALNGESATGCVTLWDRQTFLRAHIRSRNENTMPDFVSFVTAFYDMSVNSVALPEGVSISISMRGYVQTRTNTCCEITAAQLSAATSSAGSWHCRADGLFVLSNLLSKKLEGSLRMLGISFRLNVEQQYTHQF